MIMATSLLNNFGQISPVSIIYLLGTGIMTFICLAVRVLLSAICFILFPCDLYIVHTPRSFIPINELLRIISIVATGLCSKQGSTLGR